MSHRETIGYETLDQVPDTVISQGTMLWNRTGSWRYLKPVYRQMTPPCNNGCPAGNNIEGMIRLAEAGKYSDALRLLKEENPLTAVCGRVCFHPCETACNRKEIDAAISIHAVERAVSEHGREGYAPHPVLSASGKTVAVVGSGPAGLSCAWHLARLGHRVVVFEKADKPGGILRYGIPAYRLPKDVLDRDIADIEALGVEIRCNTAVGKDLPWSSLEGYDAVFIGIGCHQPRPLFEGGEETEAVWDALRYLTLTAKGDFPAGNGKTTIVIGGGNSAIDAARTARRLGNAVTVYYHRTRTEMPAFGEEILEAEKEGVAFEFLAKPLDLVIDNRKLRGVRFLKTQLGEPDESGRRKPVPVNGSEFVVNADIVVTAIGDALDRSVLPESLDCDTWKIKTAKMGATGADMIFAGGDAACGDHNIAEAIGSGKASACAIDSKLSGFDIGAARDVITIGSTDRISASRYIMARTGETTGPLSKKVADYDKLNTAYFTRGDRPEQPHLPVQERLAGFDEVAGSLSLKAIQGETERCCHCGVCTACDNCLVFCPDVSVIKRADGTGYDIDLDYCKGCGICVNECPRAAMAMEEDK
ncbi:MAG TPA: glutamate synthase [Desulfobacteraceae bacterium]|nr:glutamate synthase [Desulfobacteraceae bacterium]